MTSEGTARVMATADVILVGGRFADRFYEVLFDKAPETRGLFDTDTENLKIKFVSTLASIIGSIERPEMFHSILQHLGRKHHQFGVLPPHYVLVGEVLSATLNDILGDRFTSDVQASWEALYAEFARQMQEAAQTA